MATLTKYSFTKEINLDRLTQEITSSSITTALDHIDAVGAADDIWFKDALSSPDQTTLGTLVTNHVATPLDEPAKVVIDGPLDIDGSPQVRVKMATLGATFFLLPIEGITAELNSCVASGVDGTSREGVTQKIYDASNVEITAEENEVNAVKTVVDFEPPWNYEIIGGRVRQNERPTTPVRCWVVAVPDVPANLGGSKEMIGGVNLEFIDPSDKVAADGRVAKFMRYNATYHTNKLRFILKHNAGVQHRFMIVLDLFREP